MIRFRDWMGVLLCVASFAGASPAATTPSVGGRMLALTITDLGTAAPLPGTEVSYRMGETESKAITDDRGVVTIPLPATDPEYLRITATATHHVPMSLAFRNTPDSGKQPVPAAYTIPLEMGSSLGGIIQDTDGKAVAGATVYLLVPAHDNKDLRPAIWDFPVKTDEKGHWHTDVMPADLKDIWIRLAHPDYASDTTYGQTPRPPMEKLRDETGVMVLKQGITIAGQVTDGAGKPIAGASVAQGRDRWGSDYPSTKTGADGRYAFKNTAAGDVVLTVQAKGFAPDLRTVSVTRDAREMDFKLAPGNLLKGRVIDKAGKPVAKASVIADTWRGNRSIEWETETDAEGQFTWDSAPPDGVLYHAIRNGYAYNRKTTLSATGSGGDATIVLSRPLQVHVGVIDGETGKPVEDYQLIRGTRWEESQPASWDRRNSGQKTHAGGAEAFAMTETAPAHEVRIEADGYAPAESRVFKDDEGSVTLELKLKRAQNLSAVVMTPDGKPAAGAEVSLAVLPNGLQVQNGRVMQSEDHVSARTDAAGRFSLPPQTGKWKAVILHDAGYAVFSETEIGKDAPIQLQAWGRLSGIVRVGAKAGEGETVYGWYGGPGTQYNPAEPHVTLSVRSTAGADGRFSMDRVIAGEIHLVREVKLSDRMTGYSQNVPITLAVGQSATVAIGGMGRPVVGRAEIPADLLASGAWDSGQSTLRTSERPPEVDIPDHVKDMAPADRQAWYETWKATAEGKAYESALAAYSSRQVSYPVKVNADGTFRIDDVTAGKYKLTITVSVPPTAKPGEYGEERASTTVDVEVPTMARGRSDDALELPLLALTPIQHLKVGDTVPNLAIKGLDGAELHLADFHGRYVLLDFWATWCGPCVAETPFLKATHDAFGQSDRFAMVSLSLDPEAAAPRKFVQRNQITWPQAFLGEWEKSTIAKTFGFRGIPAIYLIGPDGKIAAMDLRGEAIKTTVATAISR